MRTGAEAQGGRARRCQGGMRGEGVLGARPGPTRGVGRPRSQGGRSGVLGEHQGGRAPAGPAAGAARAQSQEGNDIADRGAQGRPHRHC